ncbi:hypothetical protein [Hyphomicrobium sp. ghe19]|uniref:hypothetical protein n=1 Tax=Hyphomicrobium sp. ghe19 TaxID=2682968 RepID=UPI001366C5C5|nr:hypothetical protein HYPP_02476 [Hyphomicrobium sp. ghe19]
MTATARKIDVPMMVGTSGYKNYMAFAKNGAFALGIKPVTAVDGKRLGVPGTTWFAARLRSAAAGDLFQAQESNVVGFKKLPETHEEAWPSVTWEKNKKERASTTVSILVPGTTDSPEETKVLIASIGDAKLAVKMVDYLEKIVGKENFAIDRETAIAWFEQTYGAFAAQLEAMLKASEALKSELEATQGTFGMHAELLKKVYKAAHGFDQPEEEKVALSEDEADESGEEPEDENDNDSY